ncbi:hypothetical protein [Paracoccus ravus]|uniref:hypothetical protein n=1 Tax=Paracoccus ravus TaxID=2447760 RepID=UPI00106E5938|nr:hypothetical protein [Paracoccus ravus]
MALETIDKLDLRTLDGISAIWVMGEPAALYDGLGNLLHGTPENTPPEVLAPPSILPAIAVPGQTISLFLGEASGSPEPVAEWDFTLDGVSIRDRLDGEALTMELVETGIYALQVTWTNAAGTLIAETASLTVAAVEAPAIDYANVALAYFDAGTTIAGTAQDVTALNTTGSGGFVLAKTGTGSAVQMTEAGLVFADGSYLQSPILANQPTTDGLFVVADVTLTGYGSNIGQIIDGTGGHVKLRNNAGTMQSTGVDDNSVNLGLGAAQYGNRIILAAEIDDLTDTLSGYDVTGNLLSVAHAGLTDPSVTRLSVGRYLKGTIHRLAVFGRPEGQPWNVTMREVVEDFQQGA